jgi:hypothetical protein
VTDRDHNDDSRFMVLSALPVLLVSALSVVLFLMWILL